jgi:hypothetical protein
MVRCSASGKIIFLIARKWHMDKQVFAKVGVFVLLGLNVAAYYVFWPSQKQETNRPREEKGEVALLPTKADKLPTPARPKDFPAGSLNDAVVLPPPILPKPADQELKPDEAVNRLLEHIKKEGEGGKVVLPPDDPKPKALPPLQVELLVKDPNIGVTSALTAKAPEAVDGWTLKKEKVIGSQTLVTAKVHNPGVEFRFTCGRVEMLPDGAALVARGGVDLECNGLRVVCQTLTVEFSPQRLTFAGQVSIFSPQARPSAPLLSDRATWLFPRPQPTPGFLGPPR